MFWGRFLAILQSFKQSLKYVNTLVNNLRCYFERNNKVSSFTEKALGFVYKNSKWSDLKNDNIKPTFKLQLKSIFGVITGWFVVFFILSYPGLKLVGIEESPAEVALHYIHASGYDWCLIPFITLVYIIDRIYEWWSDHFFNYFTKSRSVVNPSVSDYNVTTIPTSNSTKHKNMASLKDSNLNLGNRLIDPDIISLVHAAEECRYYIGLSEMYIDKSSLRINNRNYKLVKNLDILEDMLGEKITIETMVRAIYLDVQDWGRRTSSPKQDFSITKKYKKYTRVPANLEKIVNKAVLLKNNKSLEEPSYSFIKVSNLKLLPSRLLTGNIFSNILTAKQTKWLYKNNILSDVIVPSTNGLTNLKKLLGSQRTNESMLKQNLWLTNKAYSNKQFLKMFKSFKGLGLNNNFCIYNSSSNISQSVINLASIEEGIYWTTKRFKVLEELGKINQYNEYTPNPFSTNNFKKTNYLNFNDTFNIFTSVLSSHYLGYSVFEQYNLVSRFSGSNLPWNINIYIW